MLIASGFYDKFNGSFNQGFNDNIFNDCVKVSGTDLFIGGNFTTYKNQTYNRFIKTDFNGNADTSFNSNITTGFNEFVRSIAVQGDGKILVGGEFTQFNGNTRNRIVRLNSDGTEDTAFYSNLGTGFNSNVWSVFVQSDGKILVGGTFTQFNGNTRNCLVRLNSNGTEDTAFYTNLGTGFNINNILGIPFSIRSISEQTDNKLLIVGNFTTLNGNTRNRIVRLNSNGTEDTAFYIANGGEPNFMILVVKTYSDGSIMLGGIESFSMRRLLSTGVNDVTFSTTIDGVQNLYFDNVNNKYYIVTSAISSLSTRIARLNINGTIDTGFNVGVGLNNSARNINYINNNTIIVTGFFTTYKGVTANRILNLDSYGNRI